MYAIKNCSVYCNGEKIKTFLTNHEAVEWVNAETSYNKQRKINLISIIE